MVGVCFGVAVDEGGGCGVDGDGGGDWAFSDEGHFVVFAHIHVLGWMGYKGVGFGGFMGMSDSLSVGSVQSWMDETSQLTCEECGVVFEHGLTVDDARQEAELYSEAAGQELGEVVFISPARQGTAPIQFDSYEVAEDDSSVPTEIQEGDVVVSASVTIEYEFSSV